MGSAIERLRLAGYGHERLYSLYIEDGRSVDELLTLLVAVPVEITKPQLKSALSSLGIKKSPEARKAAQGAHSASKGSSVDASVLETGLKPEARETLVNFVARVRELTPELTEKQVTSSVKRLKLVAPKSSVLLLDLKPEAQYLYRGDAPFAQLTAGMQKAMSWQCELGHDFEAAPQRIARVNKPCPYCGHRKLLRGFNDVLSQKPLLAKEWSPLNEKSADQVCYRSNYVALWECSSCDLTWERKVRVRSLKGLECPSCRHRSSGYENYVHKLLKELYAGAIVMNTYPLRDGSKRYQIDLFLPELNLGFEIQDYATHSRHSDSEVLDNPWLYWALEGQLPTVKKGPTYHALKHRLAEAAGIRLIEIWQDELEKVSLKEMLRSAIAEARTRTTSDS